MPGQPPDLARLLVVGANHRTGSVGIRDRLFFDESELSDLVSALCHDGIQEAFPLATCDRVEVVVSCDDRDGALDRLKAFFRERGGNDADEALYTLEGDSAISHIFRVAASLDSQVVGEPQVLGQVKHIHRRLRDSGAPLSVIGTVLDKAYEVAKRIRTETAIAEGPVTIVAAAVRVARDLHGELADTSLLVVGGGDAGELIAEGMIRAGQRRTMVTAARQPMARSMAERLGASVGEFDNLVSLLEMADTVVFAHGAREPLVSRDLVRAVLRRRRQKPVFMIDTSIPSDCAPDVGLLESVFLYDLADLERLASDGLNDRTAAAERAEAIVAEEVSGFRRRRSAGGAGEAIRNLHESVERMRLQALADSGGDAEKATRLLAGRILNAPTEALRRAAAEGRNPKELEELIAALFRGDGEDRS